MSISVESTSHLGRRLKVIVPADEIESKFAERIKKLAVKVKIPGFRPGKVPLDVVKSRYGQDVRNEVIDDVVRTSLEGALDKEKLNPASRPMIEEVKFNIDQGEPLEYTATFEVYPQVTLADFKKINIERPAVEINDEDLQQIIEKIRVQFSDFGEVSRPAQLKDKLIIDFVGSINEVPFEGGSAKDVALVLGEGKFIPGFESGLEGASKDEHRDILVTFPKDYPSKDLAGKEAKFAITVHSVSEPKLPELNEDFFKKMGAPEATLESFKEQVNKHMNRELTRVLRFKLKSQIFDQLFALNQIELPHALVEHEMKNLHQQMHGKHDKKEVDHDAHQHPEIEPEARKRVALSILLGEIIKNHHIKPEHEKVAALIEEAAQAYQDPSSIEKWFKSHKESLAGFEAMAVEEQVVDFLLTEVTVNEKPMRYSEVMQMQPASSE